MPKYKIVFTDYYYPNNDKEIEILGKGGVKARRVAGEKFDTWFMNRLPTC